MKYKLILDENVEEITIITNQRNDLIQQIENLIQNYSLDYTIIGYKDEEMRKFEFKDIECITIVDRKVYVIDEKANLYRIQERLKDLEDVLPSNFIRINKSTIANENCIARFVTMLGGGVDAIFKCGYREYVSRRCFAQIRRRYEGE